MSCIRQITMTETIRLLGTLKGKPNWFIFREQYCYEDIISREIVCSSCEGESSYKKIDYYRVLMLDEEYYVPSYAATHDEKVHPEYFKSYADYFEYKNIQPADWKKAYYELTGFDISKLDKVQFNDALIKSLNVQDKRDSVQED